MPWWGELIYFIGYWITLFPIFIGIYRIKQLDHKTAAVFIWMCSMLFIQIYSSYQAKLVINNNPSGHLMVFLNALLGGYFFYFSIKKTILRKIVLVSGISLLTYLVVYPLFIVNILHSHSLTSTVHGYFLMVWSFIYLFDMLKRDKIIILFESVEFIITVAILLYFGTTMFVQLLHGYVMMYMKELGTAFRYTDISIMIVYYFLIGIGLWKTKLQKT